MLRRPLLAFLLVWIALTVSSCSLLQPPRPLSPLSENMTNTLKPGLLPRYFAKFFGRNVGELPEDTSTRFKTWVGEPIMQLDHQFGNGEVFGSGTNRGIGIRMRGALHFPLPGTYTFQALSNDGIQMYLGETMVVNDPVQHSDQLSGEYSVLIPEAGWYPLQIEYFQRKGTAALKLYWKTPDNNTMAIVPADAYGHIPVE